jgi:hypothetical protein
MPICNWICHTAFGVRRSHRSFSLLDSIVSELSPPLCRRRRRRFMPFCNWMYHTAVISGKCQRSLSFLEVKVVELSWFNNLWALSTSFIEEEEEEDSCLQRSFKLRQFLCNRTLLRRSVSFCCILDRFFYLSSSTVSILWTSLNPNLSSVFASWKFEARSIFAFWKFESQPFFSS